MKILSKITPSEENILLTTNRKLYRIGLDTYRLKEQSSSSDLSLVTFRSVEFSYILNEIVGDIVHVGITQENPDHLRLHLHISNGRQFIFDSFECEEINGCNHYSCINQAAQWFEMLPNEKPYDRILLNKGLAEQILRMAKRTPVEEFLSTMWNEFESNAQNQRAQNGRKTACVKGKYASFIYITQLCGRVIFMATNAI